MTEDMTSVFEQVVNTSRVFLASGSDLDKIQEQVPARLLDKCEGVFSCSAKSVSHWREAPI